jgi:hypothetical protein
MYHVGNVHQENIKTYVKKDTICGGHVNSCLSVCDLVTVPKPVKVFFNMTRETAAEICRAFFTCAIFHQNKTKFHSGCKWTLSYMS